MFTQASGAEINAEDEEEGNKEKSNEEGCNTQLDITLTLHIKLTFKTPPPPEKKLFSSWYKTKHKYTKITPAYDVKVVCEMPVAWNSRQYGE